MPKNVRNFSSCFCEDFSFLFCFSCLCLHPFSVFSESQSNWDFFSIFSAVSVESWGWTFVSSAESYLNARHPGERWNHCSKNTECSCGDQPSGGNRSKWKVSHNPEPGFHSDEGDHCFWQSCLLFVLFLCFAVVSLCCSSRLFSLLNLYRFTLSDGSEVEMTIPAIHKTISLVLYEILCEVHPTSLVSSFHSSCVHSFYSMSPLVFHHVFLSPARSPAYLSFFSSFNLFTGFNRLAVVSLLTHCLASFAWLIMFSKR